MSWLALGGYVRLILPALCLLAMAFLWWFLATSSSSNKIFSLYTIKRFIALLAASYVLSWGIYFAFSRESLSGKAANCALTTFTLLILIGLLEAPSVFGLIDYRHVISPPESVIDAYMRRPWENPGNLFDEELLYIHRPEQSIVGETKGDIALWLQIPTPRRYSIDIQYDRQGFRNDHKIEQASVVAIGDSFLEGTLVSGTEVLSSQLKRLLQVEVANLGQGGYGPQQELVTLKRYGLPLKPKLVLWCFFEGNDLDDVRKYERYVRQLEKIVKKQGSLGERSFTKNALNTLAGLASPKSQHKGLEAHRRSCKFPSGNGAESETLYFAHEGTPLSEEELASLDTAQNSCFQAQRLCADGDAKLVFVYIPTSFRVYCDFCEFPEDGYGRQWRPNDLPSRLEAWCKGQGIPYLDLTPALKGSAAKGELVYFTDDTHWNAKGHEVAGEAIARFLKDRGLVNLFWE